MQRSHISISSNHFNINNNENEIKNTFNNNNIEKYLNKLILISMKHKKFLEKNDYFYSQLKRKNNIKRVKLKLTPFQKYEKYKTILKKIKLSKRQAPSNINMIKNKNINSNTLLNTKIDNDLKHKIRENIKFCITNYHSNFLNNKIRNKNKTKIYINSIETNHNNNNLYKPNLKIKKNKYSNVSYDNTLNINNNNKICQTYRYKTAFKTLKERNLKNRKSIGILAKTIHPLNIINVKSRNKKAIGLPSITNVTKNYQIPLIHMNDSNFLNEIISIGK